MYGSSDCTIRTWSVETSSAVGEPSQGRTYPVYAVAGSPNGQYTISGSYGDTTRAWDAYASVRPSSSNPMHASFYVKPDLDGWVRDSEGGLLYWVPQDCRKGLHSPALLTIPLTFRNSLDFDEFAFGTSWT
jgi:WD40 repeat protein